MSDKSVCIAGVRPPTIRGNFIGMESSIEGKVVQPNKITDDVELWREIDDLREQRANLRKKLEILQTLRNDFFGDVVLHVTE